MQTVAELELARSIAGLGGKAIFKRGSQTEPAKERGAGFILRDEVAEVAPGFLVGQERLLDPLAARGDVRRRAAGVAGHFRIAVEREERFRVVAPEQAQAEAVRFE